MIQLKKLDQDTIEFTIGEQSGTMTGNVHLWFGAGYFSKDTRCEDHLESYFMVEERSDDCITVRCHQSDIASLVEATLRSMLSATYPATQEGRTDQGSDQTDPTERSNQPDSRESSCLTQ